MGKTTPETDFEFATYTTKQVDLQLPTLAKDPSFLRRVDARIRERQTHHTLRLGDSRDLSFLDVSSVHLAVTSPPYWILKKYNEHEGQLGDINDYEQFHEQLNKVWSECLRTLVPGGRLVVVV